MRASAQTVDSCCEHIDVSVTPCEWLIIRTALAKYVDDKHNREANVKRAKKMLETKVKFTERG